MKGTPTFGSGALAYLSVSGPDSASSGSNATLACTAVFDDGTSQTVKPSWSVDVGAAVATVNADGLLTAASGLTTNVLVTVRAVYAAGGLSRTGAWKVVVKPDITIAEALDNTTLTFTTGGAAEWFGQTTTTHDGSDALRSGAIDHGKTSYLQTVVTGPGELSFWWMTSSEYYGDYLKLLVDGSVVRSISGISSSWTQVNYAVSGSGTHTIQWRYIKDGSLSSGLDAGFVDQVVWTPGGESEPTGDFLYRGSCKTCGRDCLNRVKVEKSVLVRRV